MSRGKRHRPLRTGVKRRQRERKAEAVVRFRSLDKNAVVRARVGQSDGRGGGGIGGQGGRDGSAAQGEAPGVQVVKECTPEPKTVMSEIVGGPQGKERERRHSRWSRSGTRKRERAPDRRDQTRSRSPEQRGAGLERSSRRCLFNGSPQSRPPPSIIEKSFLDDVSDISDWEVQDMPEIEARKGEEFRRSWALHGDLSMDYGGPGDQVGLENPERKGRKPTDPKDRVMRRLFVRNLPRDADQEEITQAFSQFGEVEDVFIPPAATTYGFVTFKTLAEVDHCMSQKQHHQVRDRQLSVRRQMPKDYPRELENGRKIFLCSPSGRPTATQGLDDSISDKDLEDYFNTCGRVVSVKQLRDRRTQNHKGVGFVEFDDPDGADKAVLLAVHIVKNREIEVRKAEDDDSRRNNRNDGDWTEGGGDWNEGGGNWNQEADHLGPLDHLWGGKAGAARHCSRKWDQAEAEEERSKPVQVGGGAFLGKDDLEDISDEEVDWSNDGENIMIVEESIDEEESNCEFTNEREVIERPTVFDRLGHRSPVVKIQPVTIKDRLGGPEETTVTMEPVTVKLRLGSPSRGSKVSLRGRGQGSPRRSEWGSSNSFRGSSRRSSRSREASLEKGARRSLSREPSARKGSRDGWGRASREEQDRTSLHSGGSRRISPPRSSLRGSPSRGSRGSLRGSPSRGSRGSLRGSPSRCSRGSLSPRRSDLRSSHRLRRSSRSRSRDRRSLGSPPRGQALSPLPPRRSLGSPPPRRSEGSPLPPRPTSQPLNSSTNGCHSPPDSQQPARKSTTPPREDNALDNVSDISDGDIPDLPQRRSLRGSRSRSRGSKRASSSRGSRGSPSRSSKGSLSPWRSDSNKKKTNHVDLSSEAGETELRKLADQEIFVEEGQLILENEGGQWMVNCLNMDLDTPEALRSPAQLGEEEKGNNQVPIVQQPRPSSPPQPQNDFSDDDEFKQRAGIGFWVDEEEMRRKKKSEEVMKIIERGRQRREEEENRYRRGGGGSDGRAKETEFGKDVGFGGAARVKGFEDGGGVEEIGEWGDDEMEKKSGDGPTKVGGRSKNKKKESRVKLWPGYHISMKEVSEGSVWDSHCHLDFLARKLNRENVKGGENLVKSLQSDGQNLGDRFGGCIANFCHPRDWGQGASKVLSSCKSQNRVFLTLGCHPHFADKMDSSSVDQLQRLAREMKGRVVAIGECGLDKSGKNRVPMDVQMKYFEAQIDVARNLNLPLVLHIRGAEEEAIELLRRKQVPANYRIHYHCFTGTLKAAEAWLSSYPASKIGLTGLVTFTHAKSVREVASGLPLDKLLLETDAPYFLPSGISKKNYEHTFSQPGHVIHVAAQVAALRPESTLSEVLAANRKNIRDIYGC